MIRIRLDSCGVAVGLMLLVGCAGTRYVQRSQTGGTIAITGVYDKSMDLARKQMEQHCQGPYTVLEEGEVIVGEETHASAETKQQKSGAVTTNAGTTTTQKTEWRVTYACGYAQPAGAPAPAQAPVQEAPAAYPAVPAQPAPAPAPGTPGN
ncbi:MAG: hypothetical protein HY698_15895 [Deltaproteobacteria bacterium]|nr:hypothetical protein [Deltaproteobacteria bacterium]